MDFFDFIRELRKGKPDVIKAAKAMKMLAWICTIGGVWNFIIYFIVPVRKNPFDLPPQYPYLALTSLLLLGMLFFRAARGIREMEAHGKKTGQIAIILLFAIILGFMFLVFPAKAIPFNDNTFSIILMLFVVLFVAQLGVPAYFGVLYLSRLPVREGYLADRLPHEGTVTKADRITGTYAVPQMRYREALLPFGIIGTFAIIMAIFFLAMFVGEKYAGQNFMHSFVGTCFFIIFSGLVAYNYLPSSFQEKREVTSTFTGGGSIFLFHGSWPFFRLMVYKDGLEVRFMFHRFFIPYDRMEDIPDKPGFFNRGILIKSDLPDVPSGIRFSGFGMKKIIEMVNEARSKYLSGLLGNP